jgi:hypothetical protein
VSRERLRARADRANQEADLGELLSEWGYSVVPDRVREQQFSCDLHGADHKPSARYYGLSNSTYCWVCQKKRDAIAWVMEKDMVGFREAVEQLEERLGLEPLPWDDERDAPKTPEQEFKESTERPSGTYEQHRDRLCKFLETLTTERDLDSRSLLAFWEVFDRVEYGVARQNWGEPKGISAILALRERVMTALKEHG